MIPLCAQATIIREPTGKPSEFVWVILTSIAITLMLVDLVALIGPYCSFNVTVPT